MKSKLPFVFLATVLAVSAVGQQTTAAADAPATREDILHLFEVMQVHQQMRSIMQLMLEQQDKIFGEMIKKRDPGMTDAQIAKSKVHAKDFVNSFPVDEMLRDMIPVYQKHLSKRDVDAMIVFYASPTGQKLLREQPAMSAESMVAVSPRLKKAIGEMSDQAEQKAREEAEQEKMTPVEKPEQRKN
jgi:hypothetical protein